MATTSFVDNSTLIQASWLNDVDTTAYQSLTSVAGTNTITATGPASMTAYAAGQKFRFIPAATNSGATTLNITPTGLAALGAKNIFSAGAACVGGEIVSGVPCEVIYDGTQFSILGSILKTGALDLSAGTLGQIKFPAAQNPSSNVNTLDDYEEGTWTPSVGGSATYTIQEGYYVKVGQLVYVQCKLFINAIGSGSATTISGLPFAAINSANASTGGGAVAFFQSIATSVTTLSAVVTNNASTVTFSGLVAAGATMSPGVSVFQNSARVDFSAVYQAAA